MLYYNNYAVVSFLRRDLFIRDKEQSQEQEQEQEEERRETQNNYNNKG